MRGRRDRARVVLARYGVLAVVLAWNLWRWRAQLTGVPYLDDSSVHEQMVRFATQRLAAGHLPLTSWFPDLGLGSPQFLHYQSLGAMLSGALGTVLGGDAAFRWTLFLLLALWPLAVYSSARLFNLGRVAATTAAALAPLLMSVVGVGYEPKAYVWIGYGVWAQLWASWTLPLAWGFTWRAMRDHRAVLWAVVFVSLTVCFHFETGYLALLPVALFPLVSDGAWRGRLARAAVVGAASMLATAWVTIPVIAQGRWAAINEALAGTPLVNGYGARQVMSWVLDGQFFDAHRLAVVTVLVAIGFGLCAWNSTAHAPARALLVVFAMSLVLSFGRTTFGGLVSVLPGSTDLFMRRFMMGAQLAGLYLAGVAAAGIGRGAVLAGRRWAPGLAAWSRVPRHGAVLGLGAVAGAFALLTPAWSQIDSFAATNNDAVAVQHAADADQGRQLDRLVAYVHAHGGGRVYAGMPSNWGSQFRVGAVPVFKYLESQDVDEVGYTLRTASLMTQPEYYFDESDPGDYPLFGVHYLILPVVHVPPVTARAVLLAGPYRLWIVPGSGYVRVVQTVGVLRADRRDIGTASIGYMDSDLPGSGRYLTVGFEGAAPARPTSPGPSLTATKTPTSPAAATGSVRAERDALGAGQVTATVTARRHSVVALSASFDPGWTVRVDGRPAHTVMLAPAVVGVDVGPGVHHVVFQYEGFGDYGVLLAVLVLTLAALVLWHASRPAFEPARAGCRTGNVYRARSPPRTGPDSRTVLARFAATTALGAVHGLVRFGDEVGRDGVGVTRHGQADAHADGHLDAVEDHGRVEGARHPARHGVGDLVVDPFAQHHELVATEMGGGVGRAQHRLDAARRLDEDLVAHGVAKSVVDAFEPVHVAEQDGQGARLAAVARQGLLEAVVEEVAVREPRHRVMGRPVRGLGVDHRALGHVAQQGEHGGLVVPVRRQDPHVGQGPFLLGSTRGGGDDREVGRAAHQLRARGAEHHSCGGVGEHHDAVAVHHDDPVGAVVDHSAEMALDARQAVAQLPDLLAEVAALFPERLVVFVACHCVARPTPVAGACRKPDAPPPPRRVRTVRPPSTPCHPSSRLRH